MESTSIFGLVIISAVIITLIGQYKKEYALLSTVVAGVVILVSVLSSATSAFYTLRNIVDDMGIKTSYFTLAFKTLGICVITGFASDLCKDFGNTSLASRAELAGRCAVFIISLPLLVSLIETAYGFIR